MQIRHQNAQDGLVFVPMRLIVAREGERIQRLYEAHRPFKQHMTMDGPKPIEMYFAKVSYEPAIPP